MKKYILGISLMIAIVVVAVAACSKSGGDAPDPTPPVVTPPVVTPPTTTPPATTATVEIKGFAFSKAQVNLKTGGTVTWTNSDTAPHTVTDNNGGFDSGTIDVSKTYAHTFATAGTYIYHCTFHSTMAAAKVVVTD